MMDWFMRSSLALRIGMTLYIVFEILAVPILSILTIHKKVGSVVRGTTIFMSFVLTVATPILIATPFEAEYLHLTEEDFGLYLALLFFVGMAIPFAITLSVDLFTLYRLRDPHNKWHAQIKYFQSDSGVVSLLQALLILLGAATLNLLAGFYSLINFPKQFRILSMIPVLVAIVLFPIILIKLWRKMLLLIQNVGEYPKG